MPLPISVVLISKNAASSLKTCLASCHDFDEIVLVDSGSEDDTITIANAYGAKVIHQHWLGFGPQKQFAVAQARNDWVLCLDCDEWLSANLLQKIKGLPDNPQVAAYQFPRCNKFMGRFLRHGEGYPDWSLRLFDRRRAGWSEHLVHEYVQVNGPVARLAGDLMHESGEDIGQYLAKQNRYTDLQADALFRRGQQVGAAKLVLSPLLRFLKFFLLRQGFRDGIPGLVHIAIGCGNSFIKYAKLWERHRLEKKA